MFLRVMILLLIVTLSVTKDIHAYTVTNTAVGGLGTGNEVQSGGLAWLNLTATAGMSAQQIADDSTFDGYVHATRDQYLLLLTDYGITQTTPIGDFVSVSTGLANALNDFHSDDEGFGSTYNKAWSSGLVKGTQGLYSGANPNTFGIGWSFRHHAWSGINTYKAWQADNSGYNQNDYHIDGEYGHFMVRSTAVPEPTSIALLGIGIVGLAGAEVRRRRKKIAVGKS